MGCTLHEHGHSHGAPASPRGSTAAFNESFNNDEQLSNVEFGSVEHSKKANGSHGHAHGHNINVRAAFIHVVGDFLQSLGVLAASLVIYFKPEWNLVDPICTFIFSVLVLLTTYAIIKDTLLVLMEGMPHGIDFLDVMNTFLSIEGVVKVHNLRIWALSLNKTALIAHLAIQPGVAPQKILQEATRNIHEKYDFFEMTLQIEEFHENMEDCKQCKLPSK